MELKTIHKDKRGSISLVTGLREFKEMTIFKTNKGYARGGCIHNKHNEYTTVIEGEVEYHIGNNTYILIDGDSTKIPVGTPHYFVSLTDSVVLEWGADPEEKEEKHKETREIVNGINKISEHALFRE